MSSHPRAVESLRLEGDCSLSLRAGLLLKLERFFPPLSSPTNHKEAIEYECRKAGTSYAHLVEEVGELSEKQVLDFGCGWGGETAWLAKRAGKAVGCDINASRIQEAQRYQAQTGLSNLSFKLIPEDRLPFDDNTFDAIFSTNVFEHVMHPEHVLCEIHRVLRPHGSFVSTFGPLFYSPLGYHLCWTTQVPYAHLLFGFKPMMEIRNLKRTPFHPVNWEETGLNRITFSRFRRAIRHANLKIRRLERLPVKGLKLASRLPLLGNLFTFGVACHLVKHR